MRTLRLFTTVVFVIILLPQSNVAQQQSKFACRVRLDITGDDKIKSEISSYISRELRSLGDVTITTGERNLDIEIVALQMQSQGQLNVGYAFSVVVSEPLGRFHT